MGTPAAGSTAALGAGVGSEHGPLALPGSPLRAEPQAPAALTPVVLAAAGKFGMEPPPGVPAERLQLGLPHVGNSRGEILLSDQEWAQVREQLAGHGCRLVVCGDAEAGGFTVVGAQRLRPEAKRPPRVSPKPKVRAEERETPPGVRRSTRDRKDSARLTGYAVATSRLRAPPGRAPPAPRAAETRSGRGAAPAPKAPGRGKRGPKRNGTEQKPAQDTEPCKKKQRESPDFMMLTPHEKGQLQIKIDRLDEDQLDRVLAFLEKDLCAADDSQEVQLDLDALPPARQRALVEMVDIELAKGDGAFPEPPGTTASPAPAAETPRSAASAEPALSAAKQQRVWEEHSAREVQRQSHLREVREAAASTPADKELPPLPELALPPAASASAAAPLGEDTMLGTTTDVLNMVDFGWM